MHRADSEPNENLSLRAGYPLFDRVIRRLVCGDDDQLPKRVHLIGGVAEQQEQASFLNGHFLQDFFRHWQLQYV